MIDLDEIIDASHELKQIHAVNRACRYLLDKEGMEEEVKSILERQNKRIELYGKRLDSIANNQFTCLKKDCQNRQRFPERDPHETDHGDWY